MAVLIALSTPGKTQILPKIARFLPYRGRKKVAPFLDKHRQLSVSASGVQAEGTKINSTRIFAAQLSTLGISEIRISDDESADALLDIIANSKTLPEGEDVTVADLSQAEGFFKYTSHPLFDSSSMPQLFNSLNKELRREIVKEFSPEELMDFLTNPQIERKEEFFDLIASREQFIALYESKSISFPQLINSLNKEMRWVVIPELTREEQIQCLVDPKIERKEEFIDLIDDREKFNATVEAVRKIRLTSDKDGFAYIEVFKLLERDQNASIIKLIGDFKKRFHKAQAAAKQLK